MTASILDSTDITKLESRVFEGGLLNILPYSFYLEHTMNDLLVMMVRRGIYVLPTTELIDWLSTQMSGVTIEIGAGLGAIGRALKIPTTDSRLQEQPDIKAYYAAFGQATIQYPDDIEKLDAAEAIEKYKPDTVIGAYITHKFTGGTDGNMYGVEEEKLINAVSKYIHIGNMVTHMNKPILKLPHKEYDFDWVICRAQFQNMNRIWVWG